MIKIKEFEPFHVSLIDGNGKCVGEINSETSLMDVRVQIANQSLSGYHFFYKGNIVNITENGELINFPLELSPLHITTTLAIKLYNVVQEKKIR